MHTEVAIHSMNAYVLCWRKACGSLDEIPSVTRFYKSSSLWQGQRSNEGHTMTLHTYYPQPMSSPSISFLPLTVSEIQPGQDL